MKAIPLTQGKAALIDDEDWPLVAAYRWYAAETNEGKWYAQAAPIGDENGKKVRMHNVILGIKNVDHRNEDGLDNRRRNLRACTTAQNQQNTGSRGGASQYKGVSWDSRKRKWRVAFRCDGRHHFVGNFPDEVTAARAYDDAIVPLAGGFARLNFPSEK